jgi:hypothetical protein
LSDPKRNSFSFVLASYYDSRWLAHFNEEKLLYLNYVDSAIK